MPLGFGLEDRFSFVRLTDLRQGTSNSGPAGADIDAIGACQAFLLTVTNVVVKVSRQEKGVAPPC